MPTDVTFKPLKESLENPDPEAMLITDFGKWDRPGVLHIAFQTMHHYKKVKRQGRYSNPAGFLAIRSVTTATGM